MRPRKSPSAAATQYEWNKGAAAANKELRLGSEPRRQSLFASTQSGASSSRSSSLVRVALRLVPVAVTDCFPYPPRGNDGAG